MNCCVAVMKYRLVNQTTHSTLGGGGGGEGVVMKLPGNNTVELLVVWDLNPQLHVLMCSRSVCTNHGDVVWAHEVQDLRLQIYKRIIEVSWRLIFLLSSVIISEVLFITAGFDWSLHFKWEHMPMDQRSRRRSSIQPIRCFLSSPQPMKSHISKL